MTRQEFESLYASTAAAVRSYLRLLCREASLADDLLQETFMKMLRQDLSALDMPRQRAYLYKAATSVAMDHFRARNREAEHRGTTTMELAVSTDWDLPQDMARALRCLEPREQALLWLAHVAGFEHREIASMLSVGEGSVRVLLYRARQRLAAVLQQQETGEQPR